MRREAGPRARVLRRLREPVLADVLKHGTISVTPLQLPVSSFPPFLAADPAVNSAPAYNLGNGLTDTISPGTYGAATISPAAKLYLRAGTYHFKSVRLVSTRASEGSSESEFELECR